MIRMRIYMLAIVPLACLFVQCKTKYNGESLKKPIALTGQIAKDSLSLYKVLNDDAALKGNVKTATVQQYIIQASDVKNDTFVGNRTDYSFRKDKHPDKIVFYTGGKVSAIWQYEYDNTGRLQKIVFTDSTGTGKFTQKTFTYHSSGLLTEEIQEAINDKDKATIIYNYDASGRQSQKLAFNGPSSNDVAEYDYSYDEQGNRIGEKLKQYGKDSILAKHIYKYDSARNLIEDFTWQGAAKYTISYEYDSLKNVAKELNSIGGLSEYKYEYDKFGNKTKRSTFYNGVLSDFMVITYSYYE